MQLLFKTKFIILLSNAYVQISVTSLLLSSLLCSVNVFEEYEAEEDEEDGEDDEDDDQGLGAAASVASIL